MISGISGMSSYYSMYRFSGFSHMNSANRAAQAQGMQNAAAVAGGRRSDNLETPVQPVDRVSGSAPVLPRSSEPRLFIRQGADPVEMAVRMRIQYVDMPGQSGSGGEAAGTGEAQGTQGAQGAEGVQKAAEEGKCQTCEQRKYKDGSNDPGVSFKTATRVAPEQAASAVRGHEREHVVREQAKAKREDRRVVSQSVALKTSICPECGKVYVSGGVTRTTTASNPEPKDTAPVQAEAQGGRMPFSAVA